MMFSGSQSNNVRLSMVPATANILTAGVYIVQMTCEVTSLICAPHICSMFNISCRIWPIIKHFQAQIYSEQSDNLEPDLPVATWICGYNYTTNMARSIIFPVFFTGRHSPSSSLLVVRVRTPI